MNNYYNWPSETTYYWQEHYSNMDYATSQRGKTHNDSSSARMGLTDVTRYETK